MLTSFQVSTGAYVTEDGGLLCKQCFQSEDTYPKPVSNYELDEWQSETSQDHEWFDYDVTDAIEQDRIQTYHKQCEPALYDINGHELREKYHYHPGES